jgi:hypothetical protein
MNDERDDVIFIEDAFGKLRVKRSLLRRFRDAILVVIPAMEPDVGYTTEALVGPEIWGPPDPGWHRFIGRCVAWMVRERIIPIQRVTPVGSGTARYSR